MRFAAYFILISAALHVALWVLTGFSGNGLYLVVVAAIYALLALGLIGALWGSGWIAFLVMLGGSAAALGSFVSPMLEPYWMFGLIFGANFIAAILLFGALWVGRQPKASTA